MTWRDNHFGSLTGKKIPADDGTTAGGGYVLGDDLIGQQGAAGATGATGATGPTGPAGPGFTFRGAWAASTAYAVRDVLTNGGQTYLVTTAFTSGSSFSATNLALWAAKGADGSGGSSSPIAPQSITTGATSSSPTAIANVHGQLVAVSKTTGAPTFLTTPPSPTLGQLCTVLDEKGDAATNNITITPPAGTIAGSASYVIATNGAAVTLQYVDTNLWAPVGFAVPLISGPSLPAGDLTARAYTFEGYRADGTQEGFSQAAIAAYAAKVLNARQTIAYASTVSIDLSLGRNVEIGALTGNISISNPTNPPEDGGTITIRLAQDATGSRTALWGSKLKGIKTLSTAAGTVDRYTGHYRLASDTYEGAVNQNVGA